MLIVVAPASIQRCTISSTKWGSARVASMGLNSTLLVYFAARRTIASACVTTCSRSFFSWCAIWMSLVLMNTWMRGSAAFFTDSHAISTSDSTARASAQILTSRTSAEIRLTASRSPGVEQGKPASMMSTPSRCSCLAISTFSSGVNATPADCSPSRSVVSNT